MKRYSTEEIYPRSGVGKCMLYFNMSHHYRRIYSAKAVVDTNLPRARRVSSSVFCCSSPDVYNFMREKTGAKAEADEGLRRGAKGRHVHCLQKEERRAPSASRQQQSSRRASSKLRSLLSVYEPPHPVSRSHVSLSQKEEMMDEEERDEQVEGELPGPEETGGRRPPVDELLTPQPGSPSSSLRERDGGESERERSRVLFLRDVTEDILSKGIYSNRSLEKLFRHHVKKNKYHLSLEEMERELARLRRELEMPVEEGEEGGYWEGRGQAERTSDEEVVRALNSLLLPAQVRERVAESLGLSLGAPRDVRLPSPGDSFPGSLRLSSQGSEGQGEGEVEVGEGEEVGEEGEGSPTDEASSQGGETIPEDDQPQKLQELENETKPSIGQVETISDPKQEVSSHSATSEEDVKTEDISQGSQEDEATQEREEEEEEEEEDTGTDGGAVEEELSSGSEIKTEEI